MHDTIGILLVDDEPDFLEIFSKKLTASGFEVAVAHNAKQAIHALQKIHPDLILMDIQLPKLDGYEATRRIKADPKLTAIPIIVVTSYALSGDEDKARAAGCDAYISKPFSPRQLLAKVREYLP